MDGLEGGYKNISPEMLIILPESKTRVILLALRAIYSCIPEKESSNIIIIIHIGLCVSSYYLTIVGDCRLPFYMFTNRPKKKRVPSLRMLKVIINGHPNSSNKSRHKSMLNDWSQKARGTHATKSPIWIIILYIAVNCCEFKGLI